MVVRATVVCIYKNKLLLVKQTFPDMGNFWSLPGGKVEEGESLADAAIRETKEETGIIVTIGRILYVSQRFNDKTHIVQVHFEGVYKQGTVGRNLSLTPHENVEAVEFVAIDNLENVGITHEFAKRVRARFSDAGIYVASMKDIGL